MGKVRDFGRRSGAVECPHPDGGTLWIRGMTFDEATRWNEITTRQEFETDPKTGKILFNPKGHPVRRFVSDPAELIEFAIDLVERIADVRDADTGQIVVFERGADGKWDPQTRKVVREFLTLMGEDQVEREVPVDKDGKELSPVAFATVEDFNDAKAGTKKMLKPIRENLYQWVTRRAAEITGERSGLAAKNS